MTRKAPDLFHPGELEAQARFNPQAAWSERAVAAADRMYKQRIDEETALFMEGLPFFFVATSDREGHCDCSYRGAEVDASGSRLPVVYVENPATLVFPDFRGNNMFNSLGNILVNPHIGMLFLDFPSATRLRVNGTAFIVEDRTAYQDKWSMAQRCVRVAVEQVFWNCSQRIPGSV